VDIQYTSSRINIFYSHKPIAEHDKFSDGLRNEKSTDPSHLPYEVYVPESVESMLNKAKETGPAIYEVCKRLKAESKVDEQAVVDMKSIFEISNIYSPDILEESCKRAIKDFYIVSYNILIRIAKEISKDSNLKIKKEEQKTKGLVRGADYYRREKRNEQ